MATKVTINGVSKKAAKVMRGESAAAPNMRRSVDIKAADNGFVVSSWGNGAEKILIAKTEDEAQEMALRLLGKRDK